MTYDVYTVGGIDFLSQVFRAIVLIFGDSSVHTMFYISLMFGIIIAFLIGFRKQTYPIWYLTLTFFFFHGFFSAKSSVNIIDTKLGRTYVVDNVPFGVAFLSSLFSSVSHTMTNLIDNAFHTGVTYIYGATTPNSYPEALNFSKNGYAGVYEYIFGLKKVSPHKQPRFLEEADKVQAYYIQCLLPDIITWDPTKREQFFGSQDIVGQDLLKVQNNLLMSYDGQTFYCLDFYNNQVKPALQNFINLYAGKPELFGIPNYLTLSKDLSAIVNTFTGGNQVFAQIIGNASVLNSLKAAYDSYAATNQQLSQDIILGYMAGEAESRLEIYGRAVAKFAGEVIPLLNVVLQFLIIGVMPMVAIAILLPGMLNILKNLAYTTAWVYLWTPTLALLDGINKIAAIAQARNWYDINFDSSTVSAFTASFNLISAGHLFDVSSKMQAIAGALTISAPVISWLILRGGDMAVAGFGSMFASFAGRVATPETITQAITAERVGMQLHDGEFGHGVEVRQAIWGNAHSMASSYATNQFGMNNALASYQSSMFNTAKTAGLGSAMYNRLHGNVRQMIEWGRASVPKELTEGLMFGGRLNETVQKSLDTSWTKTVNESIKDIVNASEQYSTSKQFSDSVMYATSKAYSSGDNYIKSNYSQYQEAIETFTGINESVSKLTGLSKKDTAALTNELLAAGAIDTKLISRAAQGDEEAIKTLKGMFKNWGNKLGINLEDKVSDRDIREWAKTIESKYGKQLQEGDTWKRLIQLQEQFKHDEQAQKRLDFAVKGEEGIKIDWNENLSWAKTVSSEIDTARSYQERLQELKTQVSSFEQQFGHRFLEFVANTYYDGDLAKAKRNINYASTVQMDGWLTEFMQKEFGINFDADVDKKDYIQQWDRMLDTNKFRQDLESDQMKKMGDTFIKYHEETDKTKGKEGVLIGQAKKETQEAYTNLKDDHKNQTGAAKTIIDGGKTTIDVKGDEIKEDANQNATNVASNIHLSTGKRISRAGDIYGDHLKAIVAMALLSGGMDLLDYKVGKNRGGGTHMTTVDVDSHGKGKGGTVHGGRTPPGLEIPDNATTQRSWKSKISTGAKTVVAFTSFGLPAVYFAESAEREGKRIEIMTGYTTPEAYIQQKIMGWLESGFNYVKDFVGGDSNPETVKKFQSEIFKPINK